MLGKEEALALFENLPNANAHVMSLDNQIRKLSKQMNQLKLDRQHAEVNLSHLHKSFKYKGGLITPAYGIGIHEMYGSPHTAWQSEIWETPGENKKYYSVNLWDTGKYDYNRLWLGAFIPGYEKAKELAFDYILTGLDPGVRFFKPLEPEVVIP